MTVVTGVRLRLGWLQRSGGAYALHIGERNLEFVVVSPGLDLDTGTFLLTVGSY